MQVCPALRHLPNMILPAASAMSIERPTIAGDLPPSSSVTGVRFSAAGAHHLPADRPWIR
jgi:hypothetical protein